ncbi:crossover junction endonuclease EME1 [Sigmodon hispidus]
MALRKLSLSLLSTESDSEELPTFAFLKKEPSSADRNQPQRENAVVVTSDSEASCPLSPCLKDPLLVPEPAEAPTGGGLVRVLSSESDEEDVFVPLAERLTRKFLTHKQLDPEHSSSSLKTLLGLQDHPSGPCNWKKQPFPKIPDVPVHGALEKSPANDGDSVLDSSCHQLPAYQSTCSELAVTRTIPLPQKRTKRSQKVQRRGSQECSQPSQASRKEDTPRQHEKKEKAAMVSRLKGQRPEECMKHIVVVLDPGPPDPSFPLSPVACVLKWP